jgi:RNA polymerase sigma-70 factor, ECF subfamily
MKRAMSGPGPRQHVATEALFRSHAPFVARFLYRYGVAVDELDDAVQEVFLVVHRNGGYLPGPATETSYLASIAVRAASTHRRRARARRDRSTDVAPDEVVSAGRDPVQMLETHESLFRLQEALDRLDPDLRATLILVELEGESCKSVAASLRIPIGTVYWRLHRARKSFRSAVERLGAGAGEPHPSRERRMKDMAVRSAFFWKSRSPADDLLDAGRAHPPLRYDVTEAIARHQGLVRAGAPLPSWASAAATAKLGGLALMGWCFAAAVAIAGAVGGVVVAHRAARANPVLMTIYVAPSAPTNAVAPSVATRAVAPAAASLTMVSPAASAATVSPGVGSPAASASREVPVDPADPPSASSSSEPLALRRSGHPRASASGARLTAGESTDRGERAEPAERVEAPAAVVSTANVAPPVPPADAPNANTLRANTAEPARADDLQELQDVATAERLLPVDPGGALALVRSSEAQFPAGYLREERRYIGVMALFQLDRADEARHDATRFLRDYPNGPFSRQVRAALAAARP